MQDYHKNQSSGDWLIPLIIVGGLCWYSGREYERKKTLRTQSAPNTGAPDTSVDPEVVDIDDDDDTGKKLTMRWEVQ